MKRNLTSVLFAFAGAGLAYGAPSTFNPVPLTANSFTYAIVVPSNAPPAAGAPGYYGLTATTGAGTGRGDNSLFEQGFLAQGGTYANAGMPPHNTTFASINNANLLFLTPLSYITNNDLQLDSTHTNGTLTFAVPTTATSLAILATDGNGAGNVTCTVTYTDATTSSATISIPDWFGGGSAVVWGANARVTINGALSTYSSGTANSSTPYLYGLTFSVSGSVPIQSVSFTHVSGGENNIYAISGSTDGTHYTPIPVAGFNQITTVANIFPLYLNATMDQGTNVNYNTGLNTWFEQGYYATAPNDGLPPSGSTFQSLADATHYYQMGDYHAKNAVLVDARHLVANITPANPAPFSTFAFLTAGGNIGGNNIMTNICILQHQDGVNETNLFFGYDWYNSVIPPAWDGNGRVNMYLRTLNTLGGTNPKLFESFFALADVGSPVTNIVVAYSTAPGSAATTFILAVSASAGGIPPTITAGASPASQEWYPTQTATFSVTASGTGPLTDIWSVQQGVDGSGNPIYVPLVNGVDANGSKVSGANTGTLTISDLSPNDGTNYVCIVTNSQGSATSAVAVLTINPATPVPPIIDSQSPAASVVVPTTPIRSTTFSVAVDSTSSPTLYYQWYSGSAPIAGATNSSYVNVDTNAATLYCIVTNFVGAATSAPVSVTLYSPTQPTSYQSAVLAYGPLGYWPLNETNGTIAYDIASTNDGTYTGNCTLGQPGLPATAGIGPNTSVGFDGSTAYVNIPVNDLNVTGPLTVIAWVQTTSTSFETAVGHSDASYRLGSGSTGAGPVARFVAPSPDVTGPNITDGKWHQLVGTYNGTTESLYVDGKLANAITAGGTPNSGVPVWIGGAPDYAGSRNWNGSISQVAILPAALTASQVTVLYNSLDTPPYVSITPAAPSVPDGSSLKLSAVLTGTPATSLQWYYIDNSSNSNLIVGATNSTYTINPVPLAQNGYTYGIIAANAYGSNTASVTLAVQVLPSYLAADLSPLVGEAFTGAPVTYTIGAGGSQPLYYHWTLNGTPIAGATTSTLTFAAPFGTNTIQVSFTNSASGGVATLSSLATLYVDSSPTNITFADSADWQLNTAGAGSVPTLTSPNLELTDGSGGEASSAFWPVAQYVGAFTASFTYTPSGGADGAVFVLQNSAAGPLALGSTGGDLGYGGTPVTTITNSAALEFNIYGPNVPGIAITTNGLTPGLGGPQYQSTGSVLVNSGDAINVSLDYANGVLAISLTDASTLAVYSTNVTVGSLTPILGGTDLAYVGFTGADGGLASVQVISNFSFQSAISAVELSVTQWTANSVSITWPASASGLTLQATTSLSPTAWGGSFTPTLVGGVNQVIVDVSGAPQQFYRLVRIPGH